MAHIKPIPPSKTMMVSKTERLKQSATLDEINKIFPDACDKKVIVKTHKKYYDSPAYLTITYDQETENPKYEEEMITYKNKLLEYKDKQIKLINDYMNRRRNDFAKFQDELSEYQTKIDVVNKDVEMDLAQINNG